MIKAANNTLSDSQRWQRLDNPGAAGQFFYAVITTGIYCRPGCPSRRPNRDNVRFFNLATEAEQAGFRPCKRCHPQNVSADGPLLERITRVCRYIETAADEPSLAQLAEYAGVSRYHLQRQFKAITGISPKAYAKTHRHFADKPMNSSRKYHEMISYCCSASSLGQLLVARSSKGICAILLGDNPQELVAELSTRFPHADLQEHTQDFSDSLAQVVALIENPTQQQNAAQLPLDIRGTLFQQRVWTLLQEIPAGETRSYTDIAHAIGSPKAVRAVASACAANALAIVIPCHRVVRSDGNLAGYRWGLARKKILLQREADANHT
ncbi:bifunctional transcriptional activator/DNA repair enzyme AdaA [Cellvibrio sp. pealriver]|uniref:bifunctional transcriptional activator/DNA repair enzyme AdaA n=1 Tax=Cellvibrio sp. pealriver TaxID=1622269 RepID=UPI00066FDFF6|nr:methylated-DNA--[protein]-cysteine S-methyltransferase [Cellvibrio sp. pealriver]